MRTGTSIPDPTRRRRCSAARSRLHDDPIGRRSGATATSRCGITSSRGSSTDRASSRPARCAWRNTRPSRRASRDPQDGRRWASSSPARSRSTPVPGPTAKENGSVARGGGRREESRRHRAGPCGELDRDDGGRRTPACRCWCTCRTRTWVSKEDAEKARRRRHEGAGDDRLRRARVRRVRERQPAAVP